MPPHDRCLAAGAPLTVTPHRALFIDRPNRFVVTCRLEGELVQAFLPNPGRLHELLLPGASLWVEPRPASPGRRYRWRVVAGERFGRPLLLDTHRTNDVAASLIAAGCLPSLRGSRVVRREVQRGRHRFDFLLEDREGPLLLEVKSCTLVSRRAALFPDAVTDRGRRHVDELRRLARAGERTAILFVVHAPHVEALLPEVHTDLALTRSLLAARRDVSISAVALGWTPSLALDGPPREVPIPWEIVAREAEDRGAYILVLHLAEETRVEVGALGPLTFPPGTYLYVGSARRGLSARAARHRRLRKRLHWHIDHLRAVAEWRALLPLRTADDLECHVARLFAERFAAPACGFGSSDCSCPSHLFFSPDDPLATPWFQDWLLELRVDRLLDPCHPLAPARLSSAPPVTALRSPAPHPRGTTSLSPAQG